MLKDYKSAYETLLHSVGEVCHYLCHGDGYQTPEARELTEGVRKAREKLSRFETMPADERCNILSDMMQELDTAFVETVDELEQDI